MALKKAWKVYLIHHSHTDIGYTDRQDKIMRYHCDFIKQAIDILNKIHTDDLKDAQGFVWQCENFWQVRNFYENASVEYIKDFEHYVKTGEIGLSGNYLNMTDLISADILDSRIGLAEEYGKKIGRPITSGMCADVNGMAWGYADALYDHGITKFFTCVHPHHGMYPLYKKQLPFYWETPKKNKILVWNGDHYHLGNELFLAPHGGHGYQIRDEYLKAMDQHMIMNKSAKDTNAIEHEICKTRLERYLDVLEDERYPYNFVPFMISSGNTDNAPPSIGIAERVNELNKAYEGKITFQMVQLDQFFEEVERQCTEIPCYRGDWNDWWADGVGSTPDGVKIYLDARRKYNICNKLSANQGLEDSKLKEEAAENLMLYAEHTWGSSSSVREPWEQAVANLEWKQNSYAVSGNSAASKWLDNILAHKGEISICYEKGQKFKVVNPNNKRISDSVDLLIENWEYVDGVRYDTSIPIEVIDCQSGKVIPSQVRMTVRAAAVQIAVDMAPGEEKEVEIRLAKSNKSHTYSNIASIGSEGVADLLSDGMRKDIGCVETQYYKVTFDQKVGITSIIDKTWGKDILREDREVAPFAGIYEVTEMDQGPRQTRRDMGRNRKSAATKRFKGCLQNIKVIEQGPVYTAVQLDYELEGCNFYRVYLRVYEALRKIEVRVRIHKKSLWEPENLYVALPFTVGIESTSYLDKTGCVIRPGIDQLPGSCQDFYLLQNGVVWEKDGKVLTTAFKDAPLVVFGELEAKPISLCNAADEKKNQSPLYSWVMNNFWETNFKVDLGGFHEFIYTVKTMEDVSVKEALQGCETDNEGLLAFYTKKA